jgi:hypothetical protein
MQLLQTIALFAATAVAEIVGCYLPYLKASQRRFDLAANPGGGKLDRLCLAFNAALRCLGPRLCGLRRRDACRRIDHHLGRWRPG